MNICLLQREEIPLIWQIDRREVIENLYYLRAGKLVLVPEHTVNHYLRPGCVLATEIDPNCLRSNPRISIWNTG